MRSDEERRVRVITDHPMNGAPPLSTAGQIPGVTFVRKDEGVMTKEPKRGVYIREGKRFRYTEGTPIPADAMVEGGEQAVAAEDDGPKWYQAYRDKAGDNAIDRLDGETEAAFKARLADQHGPSETGEGQAGPSETT